MCVYPHVYIYYIYSDFFFFFFFFFFFLVLPILSTFVTNIVIFKFKNEFEMHYDISCTSAHILVSYNFLLVYIGIIDSLPFLHHSFKINYAYPSYFYSLFIVSKLLWFDNFFTSF